MLSKGELEDWLRRANERFRANDIHPRQRGFLALADLSKEFRTNIVLGSELSKHVFSWFETNTQDGSQAIGALFSGVYYYDACFWPVLIPIGFGTCCLDPFESLGTMPENIKASLKSNTASDYIPYWVDCMGFAYGSEDLIQDNSSSLAGRMFLENGQKEIIATISQLTLSKPNTKAILSARMAVEIYLKSLLIIKGGKTEQDVKKASHRLAELIDGCMAITSAKDFAYIKPKLAIFPDVSARYAGSEESVEKLWQAYCVAQSVATTVVRILSGRDMRFSTDN